MINKYKKAYSDLIIVFTELHNAHLDYLEGPNARKSRAIRNKVKEIIPKLKEFKNIVSNINKEVTKRKRGNPIFVPNDPALLTPEFHDWVSKGLGRVKKYVPKGKK